MRTYLQGYEKVYTRLQEVVTRLQEVVKRMLAFICCLSPAWWPGLGPEGRIAPRGIPA